MNKRSTPGSRGKVATAEERRGKRALRFWARAPIPRGSDAALIITAMRLTGLDPDSITAYSADRAFGELLQLGDRTVRTWRIGAAPLPGPVYALCRLIVAHPENARLLIRVARMRSRQQPRRPRRPRRHGAAKRR